MEKTGEGTVRAQYMQRATGDGRPYRLENNRKGSERELFRVVKEIGEKSEIYLTTP